MIPYEKFNDASTTVHVIQGAAFLFLGLCETVKVQNPSTAVKKACPAVFLAAGALSFAAVFYYLGNFSQEEFFSSLRIKSGLYLLPAFSLIMGALGVAMLMELVSEGRLFWKTVSFFFLFFLVFLNAIFPYKINPEFRMESAAAHMAVALPAALGILLKLANEALPRKWLGTGAAVLLLMAGFLLVMYKEDENSFKYGLITITEPAVSPDSGGLELPNPAPGGAR